MPGADGLVNTADDGAIETIRSAGTDGILNNGDDVITTLTNYTREIRITPLNFDGTGTRESEPSADSGHRPVPGDRAPGRPTRSRPTSRRTHRNRHVS